jgi:hypothetical protein
MIVAPSDEYQLLLQCCRHQLHHGHVDIIQSPGFSGVNWERFLALTNYHKLFPLVHQVLKTHQESVPEPVRSAIAGTASKSQRRIMNLTGVLSVVHQLFTENELPYLPIKGPVMIRQLYGNTLLRQTRDIDLLVAPENFDKAMMILTRAGFLLQDTYFLKNPEKRALYMARENHVRLRHPEKMIILELHWSVSKYFTGIPVESLLKNATTIDFNGISFPTLPLDDYFAVLAIHGIYHRFEHLFWLYDLACIMNRSDFDISIVLSRAVEYNCLIPVRVSMALVNDFFYGDGPVKGMTTPLTRREKFVRTQCIRSLIHEEAIVSGSAMTRIVNGIAHRFTRQLYYVAMTDEWNSRKRVVLNALVKPYVWPEKIELPKNNLVYLLLTQWRWLTMIVSGTMTRKGRVRKNGKPVNQERE